MHWIIDRIEGEFAVVETAAGDSFSVPLCALPDGAKEGDVLSVRRSALLTRKKKRDAARRLRRLTTRKP